MTGRPRPGSLVLDFRLRASDFGRSRRWMPTTPRRGSRRSPTGRCPPSAVIERPGTSSDDPAGHGAKSQAVRNKAILALLSEKNIPKAAATSGVGVRTLHKWLAAQHRLRGRAPGDV